MADIVNNEYEKILKTYTNIFDFSRYDRLSYDIENKKVADIASDEHQVNNDFYRNYGTYRHDINAEEYLVKENETYFDNNELNDYYYDYDHFQKYKDPNNTNKTYNAMQFAGCVLNPVFATNANEASLEDIFVEYGYEYLKALNDSYIAQNDYKGLYFFDNSNENSYSIMPIGYEYINYDKEQKNKEIEDRTETVEYDGTYVPTAQELLSGNLYIVISSGNLDYCRKVYFNNKYMPTLFINDDKLKSKTDQYVINDQQPLKLCDIVLYQRLGCLIKWESIFDIKLTSKFKEQISKLISKIYKDVNLSKYADSIFIVPFYNVQIIVKDEEDYNNKDKERIIDVVTGSNYDNFSSKNIPILYNNTEDEINLNNSETHIITQDTNITNIVSENIANFESYKKPIFNLTIKASYALAVKGFTNKIKQQESKYNLYWYKIVEQ